MAGRRPFGRRSSGLFKDSPWCRAHSWPVKQRRVLDSICALGKRRPSSEWSRYVSNTNIKGCGFARKSCVKLLCFVRATICCMCWAAWVISVSCARDLGLLLVFLSEISFCNSIGQLYPLASFEDSSSWKPLSFLQIQPQQFLCGCRPKRDKRKRPNLAPGSGRHELELHGICVCCASFVWNNFQVIWFCIFLSMTLIWLLKPCFFKKFFFKGIENLMVSCRFRQDQTRIAGF